MTTLLLTAPRKFTLSRRSPALRKSSGSLITTCVNQSKPGTSTCKVPSNRNVTPVKRLFTTTEAAAKLGVTSARVRQMILKGELAAEKFGRDLMINAEAIAKAKKP